nr:hypothetical protein [Tanacetum cinerariifolium]
MVEGSSFPYLAPGLPVPPSVIEDLSTRLGNLEYGHEQHVQNVIQVSDAEGQVQVMASQMVHATDIFKRIAVQRRDTQIQQLQTMVLEMSVRESTLMQCIIGMDRHLTDLERRPPGPQ